MDGCGDDENICILRWMDGLMCVQIIFKCLNHKSTTTKTTTTTAIIITKKQQQQPTTTIAGIASSHLNTKRTLFFRVLFRRSVGLLSCSSLLGSVIGRSAIVGRLFVVSEKSGKTQNFSFLLRAQLFCFLLFRMLAICFFFFFLTEIGKR